MSKAMNMATPERPKGEPKLRIDARVDTYGDVAPMADTKWLKEDMARCDKKITSIRKALDNWDDEKVAKEAYRSLSDELESELRYKADCKRRMKRKAEKPRGIKI